MDLAGIVAVPVPRLVGLIVTGQTPAPAGVLKQEEEVHQVMHGDQMAAQTAEMTGGMPEVHQVVEAMEERVIAAPGLCVQEIQVIGKGDNSAAYDAS